MSIELERLERALAQVGGGQVEGRLRQVVGLTLRAELPDARIGELVEISRKHGLTLLAEVVGFGPDGVTLSALGPADGLGPDDVVKPLRKRLGVHTGDQLLGRVLDGLGEPLDGGPALQGARSEVMASAPAALARAPIDRPLTLGVRALDAFVTVGEGQRMGLFAGSGVGKSTLLGQLARRAEADVFVVCLVGERGRELNVFLNEHLGHAAGAAPDALNARARSVVVCATSDAPALVRMKAPYVATAIAESFRERGLRVVLLLDSLTRFARACREVGLSAGEAPVRRGFPASTFAALPGLLERAGTSGNGSITAFYTVLVEGDDLDEPIADELRGLLDGHIVLSRALAARGRFPAIDVVASLSRLMPKLVTHAHRDAAEAVRAQLALYEEKRDLVLLGAYRKGSDPRLDAAIGSSERVEKFLRQREDESTSLADTLHALQALA